MSLFVANNSFTAKVLHDLSCICSDDKLVYGLKNCEIKVKKASQGTVAEGCRLIRELCQSQFNIEILGIKGKRFILEARGYLKTGKPITIAGKKDDVAGEANYGYTVKHGEISEWKPDCDQNSDNSPQSSHDVLFKQLCWILQMIREIKPDDS